MNRDRLSAARRSWNMSRIRGKHTAPELIVRSLLHRLGYRFRIHKKIPIPQGRDAVLWRPRPRTSGRNQGSARQSPENRKSEIGNQKSPSSLRFVTPDIVLVRYRVAIFVHGCFWHRHRGCKNCTMPTHRREFWVEKLEGNAARDKVIPRPARNICHLRQLSSRPDAPLLGPRIPQPYWRPHSHVRLPRIAQDE